MNMETYHNPVLLSQSIAGLNVQASGVYVDITFGGGGHSRAILDRLGPEGKLFAFDQDEDAAQNRIEDKRFVLIQENFRHISRFLRFYGIHKVDGILGDLGVSSHQFDAASRGFSTRFDARLDMRMNQQSVLTAQTVINTYTEAQLSDLLFQYGELRNARAMASKIVLARSKAKIQTSFQLREALRAFLPPAKEHKILAQVFQAIRIEVNQELAALKAFLLQVPGLLNSQGRLGLISYHSLEDRLVKRFIKNGLFDQMPAKDFYGNTKVPLKAVGKIIVPEAEEIKHNNRARSAKLRLARLSNNG